MKPTCILLTLSTFALFTICVGQNVTCVHDAYPPKPSLKIPTYTVNLDLPGRQRWVEITGAKKVEIANLLAVLKKFLATFGEIAEKLINFIDEKGDKFDETLPQPFADEIQGIADATGLKLGEVVLYNIFYEVFTVCTSIIAEDPQGNLYHARNLDFGLLLGWDNKTDAWEVTEALRPLIVNVNYTRSGKVIFKAVHFAGYVGVLTAIKPGLFTLSMNERFGVDGGYIGVLEWIMGDHSATWMGFLTRQTMENALSYNEARNMLVNTKMLAPAYFILGGNKTGEACVITRNRLDTRDTWEIQDAGKWYILETNYDHWKAPLVIDDRRGPANKCMKEMTQQNVSFKGIFNVLSSKPVLNKLTTYTALMSVKSGDLETWLQYCPDPCFPW
ncbi:hypothetical protein ScPMuIL_018799 [Solemya velum]